MGTDHLQTGQEAGLPFVYSTPAAGTTHPGCRAISWSELTGGGAITVLAASAADIGSGIAGLVSASLERDQHVNLMTLGDEIPVKNVGSNALDHRVAQLFDNGSTRQMSWISLHRPDGTVRSRDIAEAADQVIAAFEHDHADTLFVAAVPVPSAAHRFLDLVARRVVASLPDTTCWYFAARREAHPGAAHLLHSDGVVRTFDTRRWATHQTPRLPERFWRPKDVSALSSVSEADDVRA